jgi:hypothetical protein
LIFRALASTARQLIPALIRSANLGWDGGGVGGGGGGERKGPNLFVASSPQRAQSVNTRICSLFSGIASEQTLSAVYVDVLNVQQRINILAKHVINLVEKSL